MCPEYYVAWAAAFLIKNTAGGIQPLRSICKHGILSIWELSFIRMAGFNDYNANGAAWYISAMLCAMFILLPLFYWKKDFFLHILAPLVSLGTLGYMYAVTKSLRGNTEWTGFCYKGLLRAAGVMCAGCICYLACQKILELEFTRFAKILLSVAETGGYLAALYWTFGHGESKMEFVILVLFAVSVTVSFSHQGALAPIFDNRAVYWLGRFSFSLYLAHHAWSGRVKRMFPQDTYSELFIKYVLLSAATAFAVYILSAGLRKVYGKYKKAFWGLFIRVRTKESV